MEGRAGGGEGGWLTDGVAGIAAPLLHVQVAGAESEEGRGEGGGEGRGPRPALQHRLDTREDVLPAGGRADGVRQHRQLLRGEELALLLLLLLTHHWHNRDFVLETTV